MFMPFERPLLKALSYLVVNVVPFTVSKTVIIVENPPPRSRTKSQALVTTTQDAENSDALTWGSSFRFGLEGSFWERTGFIPLLHCCPYPRAFYVFGERKGFICS